MRRERKVVVDVRERETLWVYARIRAAFYVPFNFLFTRLPNVVAADQ